MLAANSRLHVQQEEKGGYDGLPCSSSRLIKLPCGDQGTNLLHDLLSLEEFPTTNPWISTCDLSRRHTNSSISRVFNPSKSSSMDRISTNPCTESPSMTVMSSNDTTVGSSSRVPFKWEEAPGKPAAAAAAASSNELIANTNQSCLQLPPKLQGPPLLLDHSPYQSPSRLHPISPTTKLALNQPTNHKSSLNPLTNHPINQRISLHHPITQHPVRLASNHPKLKNLCKFLLKTASWSQPLHSKPAAHAYSQSWSSSSPPTSNRAHHDDQQDDLAINHRFFFDKFSPKDLKYSVSMDYCRKPALPLYQDYRRKDELVSKEALSFLAMEEELDEAEYSSTASTPWQTIKFDDGRKGCGCSPWPPIRPNTVVQKRLEGDDEEEDEGFHDFFSTDSNSIEKPSQRTDDSMDSACSSPCPWYLQFGPEEEEVQEERSSGRKLIVRLVAIVKLKKMISSKVCKIKKRRGGISSQLNTTTSMWSPTLATYLYNQQKEERESLDHPPLQEEQEEDDVQSNTSSNRLHIDPNYYLPSSIMGHYSPYCSSSVEENYPSHHFKLATTIVPSNFSQEEEEQEVEEKEENDPPLLTHKLRLDDDDENEPSPFTHKWRFEDDDENEPSPLTHKWRFEEEDENKPSPLPHKRSLREQLVEFEDDYPIHLLQSIRSSPEHPQVLDIKTQEVAPCKRLCKVQKRVKMLVATIKLIFVQSEVRERKGPQRATTKYGSCINPMLSQFPSTNK